MVFSLGGGGVIIQFGPWNCKPRQNMLVICLLLSVSLGVCFCCGFCFSYLYVHPMGKTIHFDRGLKRTDSYFTW